MSKNHDFLIVGDFNSELSESTMSTLTYHLYNLVKVPHVLKI